MGYLILPFILVLSVLGVPTSIEVTREDVIHDPLQKRTTPFFPDQPPSCPICAKVGSPDRILSGRNRKARRTHRSLTGSR